MKKLFFLVFLLALSLINCKKDETKGKNNPICKTKVDVSPLDCCQLPTGLKHHFKTCKESCSEKGSSKKKQECCMTQCIGEAAGIFDSSGKISVDKFRESLIASDDAQEWGGVVNQVTSDCVARGKL